MLLSIANDQTANPSIEIPKTKAVDVATCSSCKVIEKITEAVHKEVVKQVNSSVVKVSSEKIVQKAPIEPKSVIMVTTIKPVTVKPILVQSTSDAPVVAKPKTVPTKLPSTAAPTTKVATPTNPPRTLATVAALKKPTEKSVRPYDVVSTVAGNKKSVISDFTNSKAAASPLPTSQTPSITKSEPAAVIVKAPASNLKANEKPQITVPTARITDNKPPVPAMPALLKAMNNFLSDLVYRFNYTTTFHGHNEEGSRNGNKAGAYFSIGRDNVRRTVQYTANENGFQPHVIYELVNPAEAPSDLTDKSGVLKGFEFKWFQPGTSRRR